MSRAAIAWLAIVVPVWLLFVLGTHWEPVIRDGWFHVSWHRHNTLSLDRLYEFSRDTYLYNNPRLGQVLTLLAFTPGPWHEILTPLIELGMFYLLAALVLGRLPSWRRTDDALVFATTIAIVFISSPSIGPMLFYRPYTGNYLYGFVLSLLWLVPYRLHAEVARRRSLIWAPVMLLLGALAGLSNEHTGPAFILAAVVALIVYWRRGERFVPWAYAGLLGIIGGTLALILAPGQASRYNGLGAQQTILERILERGAYGNAKIVVLVVLYCAPALLWLGLALVGKLRKSGEGQPRTRAIAEITLVAMALTIAFTLLASPKQGDRLYFAAVCLVAAAIAGWLVAYISRIERMVAIGMAIVAVGYVGFRLMSTYRLAGSEFAARMSVIEHGAPGSVVTVPQYSLSRSRYSLNDDFRFESVRALVAGEYHLGGIELIQRDETTPPPGDPDAP